MKPLAADVVSDNYSPLASTKPEGGASSKEPAERLEQGKALLRTEELASDKIGGKLNLFCYSFSLKSHFTSSSYQVVLKPDCLPFCTFVISPSLIIEIG